MNIRKALHGGRPPIIDESDEETDGHKGKRVKRNEETDGHKDKRVVKHNDYYCPLLLHSKSE